MLFNSFTFAIFLPIVFFLYWSLKKSRNLQNFVLLVSSYIFYGWWDWRFLSLIIISSITDYAIGLKLGAEQNLFKRKVLLTLSIIVNLGILGYFKYFNFFLDSLNKIFTSLGIPDASFSTLNIILPLGISFYTFQTMGYTIDVYLDKVKPTRNPLTFFTFVCFFPQLVAGPIERASNLVPQFEKDRTFDYSQVKDGLRQILWGLSKKIVIADNCGEIVSEIFSNYQTTPSSTLVLGLVIFSFQIYCDFSGYSDIAIGCAKLLGIKLMRNFNRPFVSLSMSEFWRRWHISLSTWLQDNLYAPLYFYLRNWNLWGLTLSLFVTFFLCGLWHGARWTFVIFGTLQGIAIILEVSTARIRKKWLKTMPKPFYSFLGWFWAFSFWNLTMLVFRSQYMSEAIDYFTKMFTLTLLTIPDKTVLYYFPGIILLVIFEWVQKNKDHTLEISKTPLGVRWSIYIILIFLIQLFHIGVSKHFIYFDF